MDLSNIRNNSGVSVAAQELRSKQKNLIGNFDINLTDTLLRNTMQYKRWEKIRQNDPLQAQKIAKLVLERHNYLKEGAAVNDQDRKNFDNITNQLKKNGIYLYNSQQIKNPIFKKIFADGKAEINEVSKKPNNSNTIKDTNEQNTFQCTTTKNCYEYLAEILEENGIAYYGNNGVGSALLKKASKMGMKLNAFLTGEGITNLLCDHPVQVHVPQVKDNSFYETWSRIEPYLKRGAILSFSSQHFGHTGVIENENGEWTYINSSGTSADSRKYRILKEDLKHEISSRLQRAKREQSFLSITLGSVNPELAARFGNPVKTAENKIKDVDLSIIT